MDRGRVERLVPAVGVARSYERSWLRPDVTAGAALVALVIPAGMAYAEAAGLPPVTGLYTTIVPLVAYAVFGPSRVLILGPDSSLAPMIAATILPLAVARSERAVALAGLLALMMGLILIVGRALGRWADVVALVGPAAGIALIAFADTSVLSRSLGTRHGYDVDGDQEMGALGVANAASGLLGGFPVSGSASRTPVAVQAGARTQLVGVVAAGLLVVFMLVAPGLTAYLPSSTLAAVVIVSAASLVDIRTLVRLARMSRTETALLVAAFLGVAFIGVLQGVVVAIGLSLLAFVRQAWDPYRTELVSLDGVPGYHDLSRHPDGERVPGLVIARFDAPLFFANGAVFETFVRGLVEGAPGPVRCVVVAAEALTGIDTTALDDLVELDDHLDRLGISLVFAEMKGPIKDRLVRFGVGSRFGPEHFFPTVNSAVKAYRKTYDL
ncbi:sodium-independent anion transporter (plasmid) [Cellulomonas sp. WB94]|uniref:SulP family inorganic anion transporter n=1 Tax=Cellulomonas sp. WB94 TaxID=2173174 RepID=UPI000D5649C1|nr:SulP family inorganic anion transporter [Cellulomonas sp. WB94]PVU81459.1 sodium-independent anion transporter [Cellulomonas sp. WB94]